RSLRAGGVVVGPFVDVADVGVGVVVGVHRAPPLVAVGQVAAVRAQVAGRRQCRVVDVVRVLDSVSVAVGGPGPPGGGDELQGADRAVPLGVAVEASAVG